jgi:Bacterial PH domain
MKPQAISGVTAGVETEIMTIYPSVASTGLGRILGSLYESIPLKINGVKLSNLLFVLPTAPFALALYAMLKIAGRCYRLTNRSVQIWSTLGQRLYVQATLGDIRAVEVEQSPGQVFYKSADLVLRGADGAPILRLEGVQRAEVFRQTILEARDAHAQVEASLATIRARQSA